MSSDLSIQSDVEIIRRILEGDLESYAALVARHQRVISGVVGRHVPPAEVAGVANEVFLDGYRSLPAFIAATQGVRDETSAFRRWLLRIAARRCCDYWRGQARARELQSSTLSAAQTQWLEQAEAAAATEEVDRLSRLQAAREVLAQGLAALTAEDRMLVSLLYLEDWSVAEVAAALEWSAVGVKVRAMRARRKMRKAITAWGHKS